MDLIEDESRWKQYLQRHGYNLCHPIGYGSFGDVFSVTKPSQDGDTNYAMKRLVTKKNILKEEYAMMEIHSLLHLQHQNIIPVLEVFLSKKVACIVMELAPLGNLEMFFKNSDNEISTDFIINSFGQILSAVDYCHSLYLAHRDINPSNVLIFSGLLVKLADFGLCFQCRNADNGKLIRCSDYLGHDNYLAPEVKLCKPYHAMSADLWSLGCVLRYLTTGSHNCEDQSTHSKGVHTNQGQYNRNNLDEGNCNNTSTSENTEMSFHSQDTNDGTAMVIISCFAQYMCQNSPQDRPTVNKALLCWKKYIDMKNSIEKTNEAQINREEREE